MGFPISRALLFLALAGALTAYAFWVYLRVELNVPAARRLAAVRAAVLVLVLLLLFDPRLPASGPGGDSGRWVLVDASMSMAARRADGSTPWDDAVARAAELERDGWTVVRFGDGSLVRGADGLGEGEPEGVVSELAPALQTAAESGAREVVVLSDVRFADAVAIRSALEELPIAAEFETLAPAATNTGIATLDVSDVTQPDDTPEAEVEVFGGADGDSIVVEIMEEDRPVGRVSIPAPAPGLRGTATLTLPAAAESGRRRYSGRIVRPTDAVDALEADDEAVTYANIGFEAGALVLVSARPGWEPRYLLPVLEDVTGLPAVGYLKVGPNRFVLVGSAADRGPPADSTSVRRAATEAALLVVHGVDRDTDPWLARIAGRAGRRLVLPTDAAGAAVVGLETASPAAGEWYASPDVPTSPVAGALAGVELQGLPPLTGVLVPEVPPALPPLLVQLRGAGAPESAFYLLDRPEGRVAVALASDFWRWAMRDQGREPYRRIWSGIAGWLLADERVASAEVRPLTLVVPRGSEVGWSVPGDSTGTRLVVRDPDDVVLDTTVASGREVTTPALPPGPYVYSVLGEEGDTVATGRFDVAGGTLEMLPAAVEPERPARAVGTGALGEVPGRPLRTSPLPYLLLILLLCGEWVARRRTGLR